LRQKLNDPEAKVKHATDAVRIAAGILLGLLGGFFDGILLHQISPVAPHVEQRSVHPTVADLELEYGVGRFV